MTKDKSATVAELIRASLSELTRTERKLASSLMANYPVAGLSSITEVANRADVSTPSVLRMAKKLGFSGFPAFQAALRNEVEETLSNPIVKHEQWSRQAPAEHILNRFADTTIDNLSGTLRQIDHKSFDDLSELLIDESRKISVVGGRLTQSIADYFATHLQVVRDRVSLLPATPSQWPHHLLNLKPNDILIIFDVRRYESNLSDLARLADRRGVKIVLFTDQWMSPISSMAIHVFPVRIEAPSGWDSAVVTMFLVEALISAIEGKRWPQTRNRLHELEELFDETRRFLKKP